MSKDLPYRIGINTLVVDKNQRFLLVQLHGYKQNEWKFVGGGVKLNEEPLEAVYREILEEVGIKKRDLKFLGQSKYVHSYDFPDNMDSKIKYKYKGQKKFQFVFRYVGDSCDLVIQEEEIRAYKWVKQNELKDCLLFPDQFQNAQKIIEEFSLSS